MSECAIEMTDNDFIEIEKQYSAYCCYLFTLKSR